jgi:hypothetical protein
MTDLQGSDELSAKLGVSRSGLFGAPFTTTLVVEVLFPVAVILHSTHAIQDVAGDRAPFELDLLPTAEEPRQLLLFLFLCSSNDREAADPQNHQSVT